MWINKGWFELTDLERLNSLVGRKFKKNEIKCCILGFEDKTIITEIVNVNQFAYAVATHNEVYVVIVKDGIITKIK